MVTRVEGSGKAVIREFGIEMYILLYLKLIINRDLLWSIICSVLCDNLNRREI